ncbi:MAG: hypothetical protein AAGD25_37365 [Cyanobacteria bacterium P01_F01_bin.150]
MITLERVELTSPTDLERTSSNPTEASANSAPLQSSQRPYRLIWFQHFHKAAGTSIVKLAHANEEVLYPRNHNGNPLDAEGNEIPLWTFSNTELRQFIDECEELGVTFVANEWEAVDFEYLAQDPRVVLITCLRDPLERFVSNFYFDYWSGYTNHSSFQEYLNSDGCFTMFNYYCRILSGHNIQRQPMTLGQFQEAKKALSCFHHIVTLGEKDAFQNLQAFLGWTTALDNQRQNKSNHLNRRVIKLILKGRIDLIWRRFTHRKQLPNSVFLYVFQQENQWDLQLYEFSKDFTSTVSEMY